MIAGHKIPVFLAELLRSSHIPFHPVEYIHQGVVEADPVPGNGVQHDGARFTKWPDRNNQFGQRYQQQ